MTLHSHKPFASAATIILASCLVVGCGKRQDLSGWWQDERERIELSQQLELKKYRFEQAYSHDFEQLKNLRRSTTANVAVVKSLKQQRGELANRIESLEGQWPEFRESTIREQRLRAMRQTFAKLTLISGRTLVDVSVASIDDSGVTIRHADGSARLRFADLDVRQREFFGLDADLALAAEKQEALDAAAYESWVAQRMVALDHQKQKDSETVRLGELAARQSRTALAAQVASASAARPLAQPATNVGNRSWRYSDYSAYRSYRPTYRYVYYYNTPSYICQPTTMRVSPGQMTTPYVCTPRIVPTSKSFADTTIPSIP